MNILFEVKPSVLQCECDFRMELVEFVATVVVGFNGFRVSTCYNLNCSGSILICLYF